MAEAHCVLTRFNGPAPDVINSWDDAPFPQREIHERLHRRAGYGKIEFLCGGKCDDYYFVKTIGHLV